ncbi:MAG: response regulator transcription factor [Verrucomicrobiales bacterium]|nr:response regulator [Verrucomicrobiota bacterium JB025]
MANLVIAEDAPHMLRLLEMTLRKKAHQWTSANNGDAALEAIRSNKPDAAILDIMMPGLNGLEVLKEIKSHPDTANIPVIILTARSHLLTKQEAIDSGVDAFLTKPFSPTELLATIDRVIAEKS